MPWTVAHQAPLSTKFSGQEYWSGLPFPSSGDLPNTGVATGHSALKADYLSSDHCPSNLKTYSGKWKDFAMTDLVSPLKNGGSK